MKVYLIALLAVVASLVSCTKDNPKPNAGSYSLIVEGGGQSTEPGKPFATPIRLIVRGAGGAGLPEVRVGLRVLTAQEGHAMVAPGSEVVRTGSDGIASATAIGGNAGGLETVFEAFLAEVPDVTAQFKLTTIGPPGGGGAQDGNVAGESQAPGGGGVASGENKGEQTGAEAGGGKNNEANEGAKEEPTPEQSPSDPNVAYYTVETSGKGVEQAGVGFGLTVRAYNKSKELLTNYDGEKALTVRLARKSGDATTPAGPIPPADFGAFLPVVPTKTTYVFTKGVVTVAPADGITIKKFVASMVVAVSDANSIGGESDILKINVGPLDDVEIAAAEAVGDALDPDEIIGGENKTIDSGLAIRVPTTMATMSQYPVLGLQTGVSVTLKVLGFDAFTNRYSDTNGGLVLCRWSAVDAADSVATFPSAPIVNKYLGIKANRTAVNIFVPNEEAMGFLKVEQCQTLAGGTMNYKSDETGIFTVSADKPTLLVADYFAPTGDGSIPANNATGLTELVAGRPYWVRLRAKKVVGPAAEASWDGEKEITISVVGTSPSIGWPLPADLAAMQVAADIQPATFMGLSAEDTMAAAPRTFTVPVLFVDGYGWIRNNAGVNLNVALASRPPAELNLYKAGEQPRFQAFDLVNNLASSNIINTVKPAPLKYLRVAFNDSYAVPTGYNLDYPAGINVGVTVRDFQSAVGDSVAIASIGYDVYGNDRGLTAANWEGAGLPGHFFAVTFNSKVNFLTPKDVLGAPGKIRAVAAADATVIAESGDVTIVPGLPAAFKVEPILAPLAGTPFGLRISAIDSSGAVSPDYDTTQPDALGADVKVDVRIKLDGSTLLPQASWVGGAGPLATHVALLSAYKAGKTRSLEFINGVAEIAAADAEAFRFFYSRETPVITVTTLDQKISGGSGPLTIAPEALQLLRAHTLKAATYRNPVDNQPLSLAAGAVVPPVIVGAGEDLRVEARGYDKYNNDMGPLDADWTNVNDPDGAGGVPAIPALNYNGAANNFLITGATPSTIYKPNTAGKAYIRMTTSAGVCSASRPCVPAGGPVVSHLGIIESTLGRPVGMRVSNNDPLNNPVVAGSTSAVKLELLDVNGQVTANYDGAVDLRVIEVLSKPGEAASAFGQSNIVPPSQVVTFDDGVAVLGGFQFVNMYDAPRVRVLARDPANPAVDLGNAGETQAFTVTAAAANNVKIINQPSTTASIPARHRPTWYDTALRPLILSASNNLSLYAGRFDVYGNWVGDQAVRWETPACPLAGANNLTGLVSPVGAMSNSNVTSVSAGVPVGFGCLQITNLGPALASNVNLLDNIEIKLGTPAKLKVTVIDPNGRQATQVFGGPAIIDPLFQLVAESDIRVKITVHDAGGNLTNSVGGNQDFTFALSGALASDPTQCLAGGPARDVRLVPAGGGADVIMTGITTAPRSIAVSNGEVLPTAIGVFKAPKAGVPFTIRVGGVIDSVAMTAGEITGLTAAPGTISRFDFRTEPNGTGILLENRPAPAGELSADLPLRVYAAGYDAVCNFTSNVVASWSNLAGVPGILNGRLVGNLAGDDDITVTPRLVGTDTLVATSGVLPSKQFAFTVVPGREASLRVASEHVSSGVNRARAGVPFKLAVTALDQHGNVVTGFAGSKTLSFNWNAAATNGAGTARALPSDPTYTFAAGVLTAGSYPAPAFPADFTAAPTRRLRAAKVEPTTLIVTHDDGAGNVISGTANIVVDAGPIVSLKLYDVETAPTATPIPPTQIAKTVDQRPVFTAHGIDAAGNDLGEQSVSWSTSLNPGDGFFPAASHLDRTSGPLVIVTPSIVSALATVRADWNRIDAEVGNDSLNQSVSVNVGNGAPVRFDVSTPATVVAGQSFGATITARDSRGNPVLGFLNGQTLTFNFEGENDSPIIFAGDPTPIPAVGADLPLVVSTFVNGVATVANSFKLVNAADQARLKVRWTDAGSVVRTGLSNIVEVDPAVRATVRISRTATGTLVDMPTDPVTVGTPFTYFANGFDRFGNFVANEVVLWKGTEVLDPIIKAAGGTDLIDVSFSRATTKVRATTTGTAAEGITNLVYVTAHDPVTPATVYDTVDVTINPAAPQKIIGFLTDGAGTVPVASGQYIINQAATAGIDYSYRIEARDLFDNRANFDGTIDANITLPSSGADQSLLGMLPTVDQPGTITFVDGLWSSGVKKIRFSRFGTVAVTAYDVSSGSRFPSVVNNVNVAKGAVASHVRISDGTVESSNILQPSAIALSIVAGTPKTWYATQFDGGGNWIGTAPATSWAGTGSLLPPVVAAGASGATLNFTPTLVGADNQLTVAWDHDGNPGTASLSYSLTNVDITPNANFKRFVVTAPATVSADGCFPIELRAVDNTVSENVIADYHGLKTLVFTYDANRFTPNYAGMADPSVYPVSAATYQFVNGVSAVGAVQFCLRDRTAGTTITITDPNTVAVGSVPLAGNFTVAVTPGAAHHVEFSLGVRDGVGEPEAAPTCEFTTNADAVAQAVYATVHDRYGNILPTWITDNAANWRWDEEGVLTGKTTRISSGHLTMTPTIASKKTALSELNVGRLLLKKNDGSPVPLEICGGNPGPLVVHVDPGAPTKFDVVADDDDKVRATDFFAAKVTALDQHNNVAWTIGAAAVNLTFAWTNGPALSSPALAVQSPPTVVAAAQVGPVVSASFSDGIYTTAAGFRLPNAGQSGIRINVAAPSLTPSNSAPIVVEPGPASRIFLTFDSDVIVPNLHATNYLNTVRMNARAADALGNLRIVDGALPVTSWAIVGRSLIDSSIQDLVEFDVTVPPHPSAIGARTKTIAGNRVTGGYADVTVNHASYGAYNLRLQFNPDPATQLVATKLVNAADTTLVDLGAQPVPPVTAGSQFYVVVEARDSNGNVEVTFPTSYALTIAGITNGAHAMVDNTPFPPTTPVTTNPTTVASGSFPFTYNGRGRAKIGPFAFVKAGAPHSLDIIDNDAARVLTTAGISQFLVGGDVISKLRFIDGPAYPANALVLSPATLSAAQPSHTFYAAGFDQFGNYKGNVPANYSWAWSPACPACSIGLSGAGTATAVLTPVTAGSGILSGVAVSPAGMPVTSPVLTVQAGAGASFEVVAVYNDQVAGGAENALALGDLATAATWRVFDGATPPSEYQRVGVPFSLRLRAKDNAGNTSPSFCNGDITPVANARVCGVKITYAIAPSAGPNATPYAPNNPATTYHVRWNNGYGTFVTDNTGAALSRPFDMSRSGEIIQVTVTDAANSAIIGTTANIQIKQGPLEHLKLRNLANDSIGLGQVYPSTVNPFEETTSLPLHAAGYDVRHNYISDMNATWTVTNQTGAIAVTPSTGTPTSVLVTAFTQGTARLTADVAATADNPLVTKQVDFVITPAPAKSLKLRLVATNCADPITPVEVFAGNTFKVCVEAMTGLNGTGQIATSYTGPHDIVLTANNATTSDLGDIWTKATPSSGTETYNFSAGVAILDGFVFTGVPGATSGNITLIANDATNNLSGNVVIKNKKNIPFQTRIRKGATVGSAALTVGEQLNAGQTVAVYGHVYDKGGNHLSVLTPADAPTWLYEAALPASAMAPRNGLEDPANIGPVFPTLTNLNPINFKPQEATLVNGARVTLNATVGSVILPAYTVSNLTISGSSASKLVVIPEAGDTTWSATDCFRVTVRAEDAQNNLAPLYFGSKTLDWELTVQSTASPYPTLIGGNIANELASKAVVKLADGNYTFGDGIFESPVGSFCLRDATGITGSVVRLRVTDTVSTITGFVDITVSPGPAAKYGIAEAITESKVVCDVNTFVAGTVKNYYLQELDGVGNYLRHIPIPAGNWTALGALLEPGVLEGTVANSGVKLNLTKVGVGTVKYTFPGPDPVASGPHVLHCSPVFDIVNSAPQDLVITNQHGQDGEVATNDFWVEVRVLDQHGNVHVGYDNQISLTLEAFRKDPAGTPALNGPLGALPKVASVDGVATVVNAQFDNGIWKDTSKRFLLPKADDPAVLKVTATAAGLNADTVDITVKPGAEHHVQIRDRGDVTGAIVNAAWTGNPANQIYTVGSKLFFAVVADQLGNYVRKTRNVTWTRPNSGTGTPAAPLAPTLTPEPSDAGIAKYDPNAVSDGVIRLTYTGAPALTTSTFDTGEIVVAQAPAVAWRVTPWKPSPTNAALDAQNGEPYTFAGDTMRLKIEALDAEGTVVSDYTATNVSVNVAFEGHTPAPIPFQAKKPTLVTVGDITDDLPHAVNVNFTAGVGFAEVILYNQDDRVFFTISGQSLTNATTPGVSVRPDTFTSLQVRYPSVKFGTDPITIAADRTLPIEVVGIDDHGNNIGDMKATLSIVYTAITDYDGVAPINTLDRFVADLDPTVLDPTLATPITISTLLPERVGRGKIFVDCTDPRCTTNSVPDMTTAQITIDPGKVKRFVVDVEGPTQQFHPNDGTTAYVPALFNTNYVVTSGQAFGVRVTAVDLFGNQVKSYTGGTPLTFVYDVDGNPLNVDAPATFQSPAGGTPSKPGAASTWTFVNGVWRSVTQQQAGTSFELVRANLATAEKPYIWVLDNDAAKMYEGRTSERLDVIPSALASLKFRKEASNAGTDHPAASQVICPASPGACPAAGAPLNLFAGDEVRLYVAGLDAEGNYRADTPVRWLADSDGTPPINEAFGQALSACNAAAEPFTGAPFCNLTNSLYYDVSFYSSFRPRNVGNWKVTVAADADPVNIRAQLQANVTSSTATKFYAYVVTDADADGTPEATQVGSNDQRVLAGSCFSVKVHALDANGNLDVGFQNNVPVDFVSDAPESGTGFRPVPYAAPVNQVLDFVNGVAMTAPIDNVAQPGHRCAQPGQRGTFVFMKRSQPATQRFFLRVSDGAGTGLDDDQIDIAVDLGLAKFVAIMVGDPAPGNEESGKILGTSELSSVALDGVPVSNLYPPGSGVAIHDPIGCSPQAALDGRCVLGETDYLKYRNVNAFYGAASHRFYLLAYDGGGNAHSVPTGDWTSSHTTLGYLPQASPQWTTPVAATGSFYHQYLRADGAYQGTYTTTPPSGATPQSNVTNTSAIYWYPQASNTTIHLYPQFNPGLMTVKNILVAGRYFAVAARMSFPVAPTAIAKVHLTDTNSSAMERLANTQFAWRVSLYDANNNPHSHNTAPLQMGIAICPYTAPVCNPTTNNTGGAFTSDGFPNHVPFNQLYTVDPNNFWQFASFESRIRTAGEYQVTVTTPQGTDKYDGTDVVTGLPTDKLKIFPAAPYSFYIADPGNPGQCFSNSTVETDKTFSSYITDAWANLYPVAHGWQEAETGTCPSTPSWWVNGFGGPQETIVYNGGATIADGFCWSQTATMKPRRATLPRSLGLLAYGGKFPTSYTISQPGHPLNGNVYDMTNGAGGPKLMTPIWGLNPSCTHTHAVYAGPPRRIETDADTYSSVGATFTPNFFVVDKFWNETLSLVGTNANFLFDVDAASVANAPDICADRLLAPAACAAVGDDVIAGVPREWNATPTLADQTLNVGFIDDPAFPGVEMNNVVTNSFRSVNKAQPPRVRVCYVNGSGSVPALYTTMANLCSTFEELEFIDAPALESFVQNGPGVGLHYDVLPTLNASNTSADKTFLTNETASFYVNEYDRFGNYNRRAVSALWNLQGTGLYDANDNLNVGLPQTQFTNMFTNWAAGNPLVLGLANRMPRGAVMGVQVPGLPYHNLGAKFRSTDSPPGQTVFRLYTAATGGSVLGANPTFAAGASVFAAMQVVDIQNNPLSFTTLPGSTNVTLNVSAITPTRDGRTVVFPAGTILTRRFCNGYMLKDPPHVPAACAGDGSAPPEADWERLEIVFETATVSFPAITTTVDVSGQMSLGQFPVITITPGPATYYYFTPGSSSRTLTPALTFLEGNVSLTARAADQFGNYTTNVPGGETAVAIKIHNSAANIDNTFCAVAIGSCAPTDKLFQCTAGSPNCLLQTVNMTSGMATIPNVSVDAPGNYYIGLDGPTVDSFPPGNLTQANNRGAQIIASCGTNCIDKFTMSFITPQPVGTPFSVAIRMVDQKGRLLSDAGLNDTASNGTLTWEAGFLATIDGGAPDNRQARATSATGNTAVSAMTKLNFAGGQASIPDLTINKVNEGAFKIPAATFRFTLLGKQSEAPTDLEITAGPADVYRLSLAGNPTTLAAASSAPFDLTIHSIDKGGNFVSNPSSVTAIPVPFGPALAGPSFGNFEGPSPTCTLVTGQCTINGLYYRVPNVTDIKIAGAPTNPSHVFPRVDFEFVPGTIAGYDLSYPTSLDAFRASPTPPGGTTSDTVTMRARDGAGNSFATYTFANGDAGDLSNVALDALLNGYSYSSTNADSRYTADPVFCPTRTAFSAGVATCTAEVRYVTGGTPIASSNLKITINGVDAVRASPSSINVLPNILDTIRVCTTTAGCPSSVTAITDDADDTSTSAYVIPYDFFGNKRTSYTGLDWALQATNLTNPTHYNWSKTSVTTDGRMQFLGYERTATDSTVTFRATAGAPTTPQDVTFTIDQPNTNGRLRVVSFTPDPPNAMRAGDTLSVTQLIGEYSANGQWRQNRDFTGSQTLTVSYNGTTAPGASLPATVNCTFSAGVCSTPLNFVLSRPESNRTLTLTNADDNATVTGITLTPDDPTVLKLTTASLGQTAGVGFGATIRAYDQYDNFADNFGGTVNLAFAFSGTSPTVSANLNVLYNNKSPTVPSATNYVFVAGEVAVAGTPFYLFREYDAAPRLGISGENNATVTSTQDYGNFTVADTGTIDYVKILDVATAGTNWTPEFNTHSMTTDQTKTLYSHGYDVYGNYVNAASVTWTGTGQLTGRANGSGTSIVVDPNVTAGTSTGSGTVNADHATATDDATGTFTIDAGTATHFVVALLGAGATSPIVAGTTFNVRVTARDAENNQALNYDNNKNLSWTWNSAPNSPAPSNTAPLKPANGNQSFVDGIFTSGAGTFALYADPTTAATLTVSDGAINGTSGTSLAVDPATPSVLTVSPSATTVAAGTAITGTALLTDAYSNPNDLGDTCNLTVSGWTSSPGHGAEATATAPVYPGAIAPGAEGAYTIVGGSPIRLYDAKTANLTFSACGSPVTSNVSFTITPAAEDHVWLSNSDARPGSHAATGSCSNGSTVNCTTYAWTWDDYGNEIGGNTWSCPTWEYTGNGSPTYAGSGHSTTYSNSTNHIDGNARCRVNGSVVSANSAIDSTITKTLGWGCTGWSCSAGSAARTCTINNNVTGGYDVSSVSYALSGGGNATINAGCTGALTNGNNCGLTVTATPGQTLGTITADITESAPADVFMPDRTFTDATAATNCTTTLDMAVSSNWSCNAPDDARISILVDTDNASVATTFSASALGVNPNGMTIVSDGCDAAASAVPNCTVTMRTNSATVGQNARLDVFADDPYYTDSTFTPGTSSPNCANTLERGTTDLIAACSGTGGTKTVRYTITNPNTVTTANLGTITIGGTGSGTRIGGTCIGTLGPGASCTIHIQYATAPIVDDTNISIATSGYFSTPLVLGVDGGHEGNQCP